LRWRGVSSKWGAAADTYLELKGALGDGLDEDARGGGEQIGALGVVRRDALSHPQDLATVLAQVEVIGQLPHDRSRLQALRLGEEQHPVLSALALLLEHVLEDIRQHVGQARGFQNHDRRVALLLQLSAPRLRARRGHRTRHRSCDPVRHDGRR
jgi:hypothetical protein